jgi:hypothetical protein
MNNNIERVAAAPALVLVLACGSSAVAVGSGCMPKLASAALTRCSSRRTAGGPPEPPTQIAGARIAAGVRTGSAAGAVDALALELALAAGSGAGGALMALRGV